MGSRKVPEEGWSQEGGEWFDSLDWEDAKFLLTQSADDSLTEKSQERLARLRQSYEDATGENWT